jgi:AAA domain
MQWPVVVNYLLSCVQLESLVAPVPLHERERWTVLPLPAETVLCGNDLTLPLLEPLQALFTGLEDMEGVFYGWPTVVIENDRRQPFVAPLFVRGLNKPTLSADANKQAFVPVGEPLPQVNMGLLTTEWFSPELVASAAAALAQGLIGFGQPQAMMAMAHQLVTILGLPGDPPDPATLVDPWRPQEVGVFNLVMAFKGELDVATRSLIKDLEWMTGVIDWRASAARFLFETAPAPAPSLPTSCAIELNDSQERALASAAKAPLTVITGPPGTGKSQTVAAIVADAWLRGETTLVTSTNNTPIDGVISDKMLPLDPGLILRTGNADKRRELGVRIRELLEQLSERQPNEALPDLPEATLVRHQLTSILEKRARLEQAVLVTAERREHTRGPLWGSQPPPPIDRAPLRRLAERACRTRWRWLKRRRTQACLLRLGTHDPAVTAEHVRDWARAEDAFEAAWQGLRAFQQAHPAASVMERFEEAERRWRRVSRTTVQEHVRKGFTAGAQALQELADALNAEDLSRREAIEKAMTYVRGWATSALSTRPNLDCRAGVIDLVIIDEASQCTLAAVLPLAYRAKRLVIVGDPQQLPPVVTANPQALRTLAAQAGTTHDELATANLTYGQDSAYTAFAARHGRDPYLLEEHYRCHPEIIQFCNDQFYGNRLTVLTRVDATDDRPRGLRWQEVDGRTERGRSSGALNRAEAEAVTAWIAECGMPPKSLGVVTPFRAQARLIRQLLSERAGAAFKDVRVGTAHTFQGGECETILFSTVLSLDANPGTVAWLEGERNLINVAVSRARRHLVVFGSRKELRRLGASTLLALAEAAERRGQLPDPTWSEATHRLHMALLAHGIPVTLGAVDEGYPLAITLIGRDDRRVDVEIDELPDGDPRGRAQRQARTRDRHLMELGWTVVRVPAWRAYLDPEEVADQVLAAAVVAVRR